MTFARPRTSYVLLPGHMKQGRCHLALGWVEKDGYLGSRVIKLGVPHRALEQAAV